VFEDCRSCYEVRKRIALGKEAFNKTSDLMRGSISLHLKKCVVKAFVWSVELYGSKTSTLEKEDIRRLEVFEIWMWRRMMNVLWTEHKTNKEILKMVKTEREIMDTVRSQQKRWLGHILRYDSLLRLMLVWRKGNINKKLSVLQYCVLLQWCTKIRAVFTGWLTVLGFDLAWFSSLPSKRLCVFSLNGAI